MTVLTFPSNPIEGQIYAAPNGIQYVYDGVKWAVETTTSTSEAVSNSTQDRVAPMFVNGNNTGITFAYNAATNTMSAEVTAVNGDRLINGANELVLDEVGILTVPGSIALQEGVITFNDNTDPGIVLGSSNKSVFVRTLDGNNSNLWRFGTDGSLQLPGTGVSDYQYNAAQEITVLAGAAATVVFTSVNSSVESIKAIIKVSTEQAPADGFVVVDSQICEMLITSKSALPVGGGTMVRTAVATIYGVTHTSAAPLATFTVNYFNNPAGPDAIQILAQPTAAVTGTDMVITTVATELANYF